ncbi:Ubiquitin carboxyl-terminal hydrolase family protein [Zostera marina]|uniref:Ubiquitin carboxyl-terminal hydrolase family protein n=1 Tax=Zostera marina TaxID=29655 RepID=A0A0K9NX77_ZOSMR|nr:Ubiquitin carboxyl-terminal hydrolase family protein [Zostera marina]
MWWLLRRRRLRIPCSSLLPRRAFINARVKWVRDRGHDLAVSKEKHLRSFHALKNMLFSHRHNALPLSLIAEKRDELNLPFRALRFIRNHPSAFTETSNAVIRPTQQLRLIHNEELQAYSDCRQDSAQRLARLLMLTRRRRLPLTLIDRIAFDLGIPFDYVTTLLSYYPDYFDIVSGCNATGAGDLHLELVRWNEDLATSALERDAMSRFRVYRKGLPLEFPIQLPRGFDLEKRVREWMDSFQNLPYVSPYEDGTVLEWNNQVSEKWVVGVLHELLHLLVSKKTEKENLIRIGEHVGLPEGFKKAFSRYPGIFYISNKIRTQTVVLRECFKRDRLLVKNSVMAMRYRYISLMHKPAADQIAKNEVDEEEEEDNEIDRLKNEGF